MNNGRMWCVVNPTVGLPLILGAVALTSMTVHHALMNHTTWVDAFLNGKGAPAKVGMNETASPVAAVASASGPAFVINVAPAAGTDANGKTAFVVTVTPTAETAALKTPASLTLAAAAAK
jgi:light-harvesting protein B-800-850 alpha chain